MRGERGKRPNQRQEACSRLVPDKPLRSLNMKPSSQQNVGHFGLFGGQFKIMQTEILIHVGIYSLSGQLG